MYCTVSQKSTLTIIKYADNVLNIKDKERLPRQQLWQNNHFWVNIFHYLSPKLALGFKYVEVTPGGLERIVGDPNDG